MSAPGFIPTNGNPPRGDGPWNVQFRCGHICRLQAYARTQLRWTDTGHAFDVLAVKSTNAADNAAAWNAKSGGY